ncbi:MAG: NAD(P)-dependent oxidoreductase [Candidatus Gracilibacteria bacterium]
MDSKKTNKIIITGAAGLVGQNLILLLTKEGYSNILAIDKHEYNLNILKKLNPSIKTIKADLSKSGNWEKNFKDSHILIQLHAQITGKTEEPFYKNNILATKNVLNVMRKNNFNHLLHVSSSVVNSASNDFYTNTKKLQEKIVIASGLPYTILRPTLMFGWFDPKHLGWLSRFMAKIPIFPIPGNGNYIRQPLYVMDFCKIISKCLKLNPSNKTFDIVGQEKVYYIDIMRNIKKAKKLRTLILRIPYKLFYVLLKIYAIFSKNPPFVADQLKALTAGDEFIGVDMEKTFQVKPTIFKKAILETFTNEKYSNVVLKKYE